ncbi:MAG: c-type cytochrome [Xanthomonadaceae bacterium]|nr:c-type cytochrome [Xanthomonadaceae bacterium]
MSHDNHHSGGSHEEHKHHILPESMGIKIWLILLFFTFITVWIAQFDFGAWNFIIAMAVATFKATLVCMFFMGLKYDSKENVVIFCTSFLFVTFFMILTFADVLIRSDSIPKGEAFFKTASGPAKFKKPWNSTPEIVAHGKALFDAQCVTCHGSAGQGNGPASAGLNPKPRNFTATDGWKNGRKPSVIVGTLTKGLNSMPAFATLPAEDRWALAHYVTQFGPSIDKDSPADLTKAGVDTSKDVIGEVVSKSVPVDFVIERMSEDNR